MLVSITTVTVASIVALGGGPEEKQSPRIEALVLDVEAVPRTELEEALALRMPERPRMSAGDPKDRAAFELYAYVQIRPDGNGWALAVIVAGGRAPEGQAYYREVEGEPEMIPRILASTLANLIAGIEAETVRPDEEDVPIPDTQQAPPIVATTPAPAKTAAPAPRPELGVRTGGGLVLAVPPPPPSGLAAGSGEIGLELRTASGALAGIALRGAGRLRSGYGLARIRIAALAGYAFRRGDFELVAAGGLTLEPFFVRSDGGRETLVRDVGDEQRASFLLGGVARVAPGYRRALSKSVALRVGPAIEIGGSAIPSGDGGVARIRTIEGTTANDLFRAGGLEVYTGLDLGVWFTLAPHGR